MLSTQELTQLGFRLAIYPSLAAVAAVGAVDAALTTLAEQGLQPESDEYGPAELFEIVGMADWIDWSERFAHSNA